MAINNASVSKKCAGVSVGKKMSGLKMCIKKLARTAIHASKKVKKSF
jgi:hypothetical protein